MTRINTAHLTHANGAPKRIYAGDAWYDVMDEDEFYDMMTQDPEWEHGLTFMGDVKADTSDVPQWKVEAHDIGRTKLAHRKWSKVVYVRARRADTWA